MRTFFFYVQQTRETLREPEPLWAAPDLFLVQLLLLMVDGCCVDHFVWKQEHITSTHRRLLVATALSRTHDGTLLMYQHQHRGTQLIIS